MGFQALVLLGKVAEKTRQALTEEPGLEPGFDSRRTLLMGTALQFWFGAKNSCLHCREI